MVDSNRLEQMYLFLARDPKREVEIQGVGHTCQQLKGYLDKSRWLTDTIMNEYLWLFQSRNRVDHTWVCSSFEFCKIERNGQLDHLIDKLCSFHCLLMPICIGKHWLVAQFFPFCRRLDIYDSLYDRNEHVVRTFETFWNTVKKTKGWGTDLIINIKDTPKQPDRNSCGLYCISFIKSLLTGVPFADIRDDLVSVREDILYTILAKHI